MDQLLSCMWQTRCKVPFPGILLNWMLIGFISQEACGLNHVDQAKWKLSQHRTHSFRSCQLNNADHLFLQSWPEVQPNIIHFRSNTQAEHLGQLRGWKVTFSKRDKGHQLELFIEMNEWVYFLGFHWIITEVQSAWQSKDFKPDLAQKLLDAKITDSQELSKSEQTTILQGHGGTWEGAKLIASRRCPPLLKVRPSSFCQPTFGTSLGPLDLPLLSCPGIYILILHPHLFMPVHSPAL